MLRDRGTMLANGGYFGHMWELYAVWTWIPAYLVASIAANGASGESASVASLLAFATIAIGPAVGTLSMLRLRGVPAASNLAGGWK